MTRKPKTFVFDTKRDAAILAYLGAQDNQSQTVRDALRAYMAAEKREPVKTVDDVYDAVQALAARLESRAIIARPSIEGDAPGTEEAADALDSLGL